MPKKLVTRGDWLKRGLILFEKYGEQGLRVERMAETLKCSKSSFYWYFKDRKTYLSELLQHWMESETRSFIHAAQKELTPQKQFLRLFEDVVRHRKYIDVLFHLRQLSQKNSVVLKFLNTSENERIQFVAGLLEAMGCGTKALPAAVKAEMIYYYYLGWIERNKYQKFSLHDFERQLKLVSVVFGINYRDDKT